jgi:hypothetical protein
MPLEGTMLPIRVDGTHHDRLQHAVLSDVLGEFGESNGRELCPRVVGVFVQALDGDDARLANPDVERWGFARSRQWRLGNIHCNGTAFNKCSAGSRRVHCRIEQIQLPAP